MIEARNLKKIYRNGNVETPALQGVSFDIRDGEFVSIMGSSGSGKSTLMHIMCFLDRPTSGVYKFEGKSMDELIDDELARIRNKRMGFIFQSYNLLPRITVFNNVKLPLIYSGLRKEIAQDLVQKAIKAVGVSHRTNFYPNQLSGGEQQRVAIARALVNNPSVIFADEPTGNLDSKSGKVVMSLLQELNEKGHTIILVTHEKYTSEHAKRIIRLMDGKIISDKDVRQRIFAKNEKELIK